MAGVHRVVGDAERRDVGDMGAGGRGGMRDRAVVRGELDAADAVLVAGFRSAGRGGRRKRESPDVRLRSERAHAGEHGGVGAPEAVERLGPHRHDDLARAGQVLGAGGSRKALPHHLVAPAAPAVIVDAHEDEHDVRQLAVRARERGDALGAVAGRKAEALHHRSRERRVGDQMAAEVVDHLAPPGVGGLGDAVHMDLALVVRAPSRRRCARERADGIAQDGESAVGADAVCGSRAPLLRADHRCACRFPVAVASSSIIAGARKRRRRDAANSLKLRPRGALPRQAASAERRSRMVRAERLKAIVC